MNNFGISEKTFLLLQKTFAEHTEVENVILFGSRAKGNYKKGSDIDLAVIMNTENADAVFDLSGIINEELPIPYHVDIIDYRRLSQPELRDHIQRVGVEFYRK